MKIKTGLMFKIVSLGVIIEKIACSFSNEPEYCHNSRHGTLHSNLRRNRGRDYFSNSTDCSCDTFCCNQRRGYNYHNQNNVDCHHTYENSNLFTKLLCFFALGIALYAIVKAAIQLSIVLAIWVLALILMIKGISQLVRRLLISHFKLNFC